jgi:hypothetical protein
MSAIESATRAIETVYRDGDGTATCEETAAAAIAAHIVYLAGPSAEISGDAADFLATLADRANAEAVVDAGWWSGLASMLLDGWRVLPPTKLPEEVEA